MEWRAVPGFDGYEVSDSGSVRSVDRVVVNALGRAQRFKGKLLRPRRHSSGYLNVQLGSRSGNLYVHRLVMLAFVGPCPPGLEVCHGNGDRSDNRLANLRYGTRLENMADAVAHGSLSCETCHRGHRLVSANRYSQGQCRACQRARSAVRRHPTWDVEALAHAFYEKIMA